MFEMHNRKMCLDMPYLSVEINPIVGIAPRAAKIGLRISILQYPNHEGLNNHNLSIAVVWNKR